MSLRSTTHNVSDVQIDLLQVKNNGVAPCTVTTDCVVSGGMWYYEVTLRSQGVMQIGWASVSTANALHGLLGVGDDAFSWGIDLFRGVLWHNGAEQNVDLPRKWAVGDVIGCALDLNTNCVIFSINGK